MLFVLCSYIIFFRFICKYQKKIIIIVQIAVNCVYIPFLSILYVDVFFFIKKHNIHIHNFALVVAVYARLCVLLLLLLLSSLLYCLLYCFA